MKDLFRRAHHASTPEGAENSKTASSLHPTTSSFPPHSPPSVTQNDPHMGSVDADFEDLWADALRDYSARTGVDLSDRGQDLYRHLQSCTSSYSVAQTLEKVALEFHSYRKGSKRAARIRTALSCVAHGVLVFLDAGAESLASQSFPGGKAVFVAIAVLIKATQGVSKRFDALLAILEKFGFYLSRLHIRLNVGIGFESRRLAIELLSKMVHTFALATQTMRQNRLHHLINVLFNREDETEATRQRVEQLIDEDSRMSLVDIHRAISQLSDRIDEALAPLLTIQTELANVRAEVQINTAATQSGLADLSAQLAYLAATYMMPHGGATTTTTAQAQRTSSAASSDYGRGTTARRTKFSDGVSLAGAATLSERLHSMELEQLRMRKDLDAQKGLSSTWHLRATVSSLNPEALMRLVNEMTACFRDLAPEDQRALKQGIAALYSIAATTVTAGAIEDSATAWFAVWMKPGAVLAAFLPMAAVYITVYILWRRMRPLTLSNISRGPQDHRMDTITLIDVLGVRILLPLDRVGTWEAFHAILLHQFTNREGEEYVRAQAYSITNATEESSVEPQSWTEIVRAGMTLNMSIVVRRKSLACPYCASSKGQILQETLQPHCLKCERDYWMTREPQDEPQNELDADAQPMASATGDERPPSSRFSTSPDIRQEDPTETYSQDMRVFRRLIVRVNGGTYIPSWIVPSRVLLVDNDVTNRGISGQLLQLFGVSFDVAVDGLEAIQWLNGNMYDLVLMAVAMPKIDGVTATSIIRQSDIRTPIVSMSSSAHPQDLLMYRNSGMTAHLHKPVTRSGLLSVLERYIKKF